jgi:hypothetical protein
VSKSECIRDVFLPAPPPPSLSPSLTRGQEGRQLRRVEGPRVHFHRNFRPDRQPEALPNLLQEPVEEARGSEGRGAPPKKDGAQAAAGFDEGSRAPGGGRGRGRGREGGREGKGQVTSFPPSLPPSLPPSFRPPTVFRCPSVGSLHLPQEQVYVGLAVFVGRMGAVSHHLDGKVAIEASTPTEREMDVQGPR